QVQRAAGRVNRAGVVDEREDGGGAGAARLLKRPGVVEPRAGVLRAVAAAELGVVLNQERSVCQVVPDRIAVHVEGAGAGPGGGAGRGGVGGVVWRGAHGG